MTVQSSNSRRVQAEPGYQPQYCTSQCVLTDAAGKVSEPVDKNFGIQGGLSSLASLKKELTDFQATRDKSGATILSFTAKDPTFRVDYALKSGAQSLGLTGGLTDPFTTKNSQVERAYRAEMTQSPDGSVRYTVTLNPELVRAGITLGNRRFLLSPETLNEPEPVANGKTLVSMNLPLPRDV